MLEDIVWTYGKPTEIISDNGEEFRSKEFQALIKRHGIHHDRTCPGHPQTNGKVERFNHELMQRLQRISAEEGHDRHKWDEYLRQAVFAFHVHMNRRTGQTPFFLQYGVEPVLPSSSIATTPVTRVELSEATQRRREHVQDLSKYRTEAAKKYHVALERLVKSRDDSAYLRSPILIGDLVMRTPINRNRRCILVGTVLSSFSTPPIKTFISSVRQTVTFWKISSTSLDCASWMNRSVGTTLENSGMRQVGSGYEISALRIENNSTTSTFV